ncbi:MAG TPA: MarR family transcriptional regulator, partial [Propionibacteriaceae bacterium]|nr:MarR family transcriptional regulator [Propionibacteriaceae bacterium]
LHVFDRLLEIALLIQEDLAKFFTATGLTSARTHLLWELHRLGPSTQQALARALHVTPRNVTGLVDALQAGGFVERRLHPSDRRATLVTLTELGTRTTTEMVRGRELIASELVAGFNNDELDQFSRNLDTIAERLHAMATADRALTETTA